MIEYIDGGVTAAKGFSAAGIHAGIRKNRSKRDLALIFCDKRAAAAAVYTTNLVKGAPLTVTKAHIADGYARAVLCNSGNANTCNANGIEIAEKSSELLGKALNIDPGDVIVASTGVIGQQMSLAPFEKGIPMLKEALSYGADGSVAAAEAIMTTDTVMKSVAVKTVIGGSEVKVGGIAKGSGMINPNMATMLVFVTTDAAITPEMLQKAVSEDVADSFNMVTVDGDTSTNDMFTVMASGLAGNPVIDNEGTDFAAFKQALAAVTVKLCKMLATDGEGATKALICNVTGAWTKETARIAAKAVVGSSLVKAAFFGADANWGRVLCALGYSGADIDVDKVDVSFESAAGNIPVCENGRGIDFSEDFAKKVLSEREIYINVELHSGQESASAWGCDLTYDYVKINGDYRT